MAKAFAQIISLLSLSGYAHGVSPVGQAFVQIESKVKPVAQQTLPNCTDTSGTNATLVDCQCTVAPDLETCTYGQKCGVHENQDNNITNYCASTCMTLKCEEQTSNQWVSDSSHDQTLCTNGTCTAPFCCDLLCESFKNDCDASDGWSFNVFSNDTKCSNDECTPEQCCVKFCESFKDSCTDDFKFDAAKNDTTCKDNVCDNEQCCTKYCEAYDGQCEEVNGTTYFVASENYETPCDHGNCTQVKCCTKSCGGFNCAEDANLLWEKANSGSMTDATLKDDADQIRCTDSCSNSTINETLNQVTDASSFWQCCDAVYP